MRTKLTLTAAFVALTFGQAAFAANQNLSTDVLVVGAGSAGLTAAVQAAEKGKKVILLEKNLGVGGSSQFAEGLFAVGSEWNRLRSDPLTKEEESLVNIVIKLDKLDNYKNNDQVGSVIVNLKDKKIFETEVYVKKDKNKKENLLKRIIKFLKKLFK